MRSKRFFAVLVCLSMVLTMLPATAFADSTPEYWVGGTQITDATGTDVEGDGWSWHSGEKTLTLSDAAIRGANTVDDNSSAVCLPSGSKVKLEGENTLLGGAATGNVGISAGIYCKGALTITGTGTLTAVGGDTAFSGHIISSYGIYADENAIFDKSFTGSISAVGGSSYGGSEGITSNGGIFTVDGSGSIIATGGDGESISCGISCIDMSITGPADITATGGRANDSDGTSCGISSTGAEFSVTGDGSHITATGGAVYGDDGKSCGILTGTASKTCVSISTWDNVTAVGGDAKYSYGVYTNSPEATFNINGGALLTAVGGNADEQSCGMVLGAPVNNTDTIDRAISVTNGALVTKGGSSGDESYGMYAYSGSSSDTTELSLSDTGDDDCVIVGYASDGNTQDAICGFTKTPDPALIGTVNGKYVVYGAGKYTEKVNGNYTHVFDSAQNAVPTAGAPFVIIDGNGNGEGIKGYALKTSAAAALSGASQLSGISVLIAGQNDDGESSGLEYNNNSDEPLQVSGEGNLVSIGGNTGNGDFATSSGVKIASGGLKISDSCDLTAIGGTTKGTFAKSCGLFADNINASGNVNLTAIGGTSADYISYGILGTSNNGGFDFSSSTVSAVGGKGDDGSCGISSAADIDNSGASLTAIGGYVSGTNGRGYGVECNKKISIDAGSLRTVGGAVSNNSVSSIGLAAIKLTVIDSSISNVGGSSITSVGTQLQDTLALNSGGISTVGTTGAGTTGQSSGLLLLVEKPQFSDVSDSGVLTAFGGSAESGGSYGINLYMNHKLALSNVNVTASGNTRAVNLSKNNDWSHPEFKLSGVSAKVSSDDVTGSNAKMLSTTTTDYSSYKYLRTAEFPSATVGDVTVKGNLGKMIAAKDIVLTLKNETFKEMKAGTDVSSWFANIPAGLTAKVKTDVATGDGTLTISVAGTPTAVSSDVLGITIPGEVLAMGEEIKVKENSSAKWGITKLLVLSAPKIVKSSVTSSSAKITWGKVKNAKGYQVYQAVKKSGKYKKVATTSKLSFTKKSLKANKAYFYKVRAYKGDVFSKYSDIKKVTTKKKYVKPAKVKGLTVSAQHKYFCLKWDPAKGASDYQVYFAKTGQKEFSPLKRMIKFSKKHLHTDKYVTGRTYWYKVRAYKNCDGKKLYGEWSKTIKITGR